MNKNKRDRESLNQTSSVSIDQSPFPTWKVSTPQLNGELINQNFNLKFNGEIIREKYEDAIYPPLPIFNKNKKNDEREKWIKIASTGKYGEENKKIADKLYKHRREYSVYYNKNLEKISKKSRETYAKKTCRFDDETRSEIQKSSKYPLLPIFNKNKKNDEREKWLDIASTGKYGEENKKLADNIYRNRVLSLNYRNMNREDLNKKRRMKEEKKKGYSS